MLRILAGDRRLCDGLSRRELLRVGGAGLLGLSLSGLLQAAQGGRVRAKSIDPLLPGGGPAHQDLWDMKPDAPEEIRGEFRPIDTSVPACNSASTCRCWPGKLIT